jgi:hypothetical protein
MKKLVVVVWFVKNSAPKKPLQEKGKSLIVSTRINVLNVVFVWKIVSLMLLEWNNFVYRIA